MGRPREHGEETRELLLAAAEAILESEGSDAISVRRLADETGTTTRAVYSLFGSKEGLLVALGARSFEILGEIVRSQRLSGDAVRDLAIAGLGFREFALAHPGLFRLGVQRNLPDPALAREFADAAAAAFAVLEARVEAFAKAGHLAPKNIRRAAVQYHALCEGLAAVELRGAMMPADQFAGLWRDALARFVEGLKR